jgi:chemotaxis protein methyltransferase CheR
MPDVRHPLSKDLTLEDFRKFRDHIHVHSGIYLEDSKLDSLRISLVTRATRLNVNKLDEYLTIIQGDASEFNELLNLITVNETSFFRFPQQFEAMRNHVLPEILEGKLSSNRHLRVWSAGCSTGEEPYTIAMTLLESGVEGLGWQTHVLGTDVSTKALTVAREGLYPKKAVGNLAPEIVARYFVPEGEKLRVVRSASRLVDFQYHNLIKEPYPIEMMAGLDIIFCRNVTIYFKLDSTRRVVRNFYNSLNEGGYLFIGHSETLTSISDQFEPVETGGVFLYRKPRQRVFQVVPRTVPAAAATATAAKPKTARRPRPTVKAEAPRTPKRVTDLTAEASRLFTDRRPESVLALVDEILTLDANNAEAHVLAAHAFADMGNYEAALGACDRALAVNPLLPVARYILGLIHQRKGDTVRAVSEFKKTIYIDQDFALAHLNLGTIHKARSEWDAAAREYENAIRSLYVNPDGTWREFLGGFQPDLLLKTCERSLQECRKAMGIA